MWTRRMLKEEAKEFLRKHYWKAFAVCLIVIIITGGGSSTGNSNKNKNRVEPPLFEQEIGGREISIPSDNIIFKNVFNGIVRNPLYIIGTSTFAFFGLLFAIIFVTIGYALKVGEARFFIRGFKEDVNIRNLFSVFNREEYFGIIKTSFIRDVYTVLWTFLFIIPGIIKTYEYSMVIYILSAHPNLPTTDALNLSREMTYGHKWDMFVLDLSFIGWNILASFLLGLGFIFLRPYKEATKARLFTALSHDSFDDQIIIE